MSGDSTNEVHAVSNRQTALVPTHVPLTERHLVEFGFGPGDQIQYAPNSGEVIVGRVDHINRKLGGTWLVVEYSECKVLSADSRVEDFPGMYRYLSGRPMQELSVVQYEPGYLKANNPKMGETVVLVKEYHPLYRRFNEDAAVNR